LDIDAYFGPFSEIIRCPHKEPDAIGGVRVGLPHSGPDLELHALIGKGQGRWTSAGERSLPTQPHCLLGRA